jgi:hypothetical protein
MADLVTVFEGKPRLEEKMLGSTGARTDLEPQWMPRFSC